MDDFVLNVRQIGQYPLATKVTASDVLLMQQNGLGGAAGLYASIKPIDLVLNALSQATEVRLPPATPIFWNGANLAFSGGRFVFSAGVTAPSLAAPEILVGGLPVATKALLQQSLDAIVANVVLSVNGRHGNVVITSDDVLRAGGVLAINPHFAGVVTAPTIWNPNDCTDAVATTGFVQSAICNALESGHVVLSYNGRGGHVVPIADDVTKACTVFGEWALTNTPPSGDVSKRIANTAFVDDALTVLKEEIEDDFAVIADQLDQKYAPLDSPQFVGIPTAPTAAQTVNSGQLATTAFVHAAVTASTTGVSSFNTRTGAVVLNTADVTGAGGAPINAPSFTGIPLAPTATPGTSNTQIATTAFVTAAVAAVNLGVTSFNTRTGAVTLTTADVTGVGAALLASPTFTGTPAGPTAAPGTNTTQFATTQFVTQAIGALPAPVTSFNGRTGAITFQASDISAVNGALLASPQFTGVPTAPTATVGTSNTQLATTAFVQAALTGVVSGVSSWNARTGAVTLTAADLTAVGGALLAGPTFTGVPAAPTATIGTNTTQIATTAFVQAALAAAPGGVSSFNGRTGAITFLASDVSAVGGALLGSPSFTGTPTAPTQAPGNSTTALATTAFVQAAIAAGGGVTSFNGRAGAVTLTATDLVNANGAIYRQADTAPAATPNTFWYNSLDGQLYVRYVDPSTSALSWVIANATVQPPPPSPLPGALALVSQNVVSTPVAFVAMTGISTTYDEYELHFYGVTTPTDQTFALQISSDGGTTWNTLANHTFIVDYATSTPGTGNLGGAASTFVQLATLTGGNPAFHVDGIVRFWLPLQAGLAKYFLGQSITSAAGANAIQNIGGSPGTMTFNAVRVYFGAANMQAGSTVKLYGRVK